MTSGPDLSLLIDDLGRRLGRDKVLVDAPLGEHTTYRVGGNADLLVVVDNPADVAELANAVSQFSLTGGELAPEVLVVGKGSNMLVSDAGFRGVAVQLGEGLATVEIEGKNLVVGGAAKLPVAARRSAAAGLRGFEWAVGVPGSVGGGVRMNAGGHGSDIATNLVRAELVDLRTGGTRSANSVDLELGYRTSNVAPTELVVSATFALTLGDPDAAKQELSEIVRWRLENQPGGQNAGSVFTNPSDDSAGRLIDAAGLKGFRVGTAEVSQKHANFIQADPNGSADDIHSLMAKIIAVVEVDAGVRLHPETRLVGFA